MVGNHAEVEKHLWDVGDEMRANLKFKSSESSVPLLGCYEVPVDTCDVSRRCPDLVGLLAGHFHELL